MPLDAYPLIIEIPVAWGELDAFGHVNNIIFFRYFESARIAYFEAIGFLDYKEENGIGPILASTSCRFRRPLQYPDRLKVGARIPKIESDRFVMEYRIFSLGLGEVAGEGEGVLVCFNYMTNRKTPLPEVLVERICDQESKVGNSPVR